MTCVAVLRGDALYRRRTDLWFGPALMPFNFACYGIGFCLKEFIEKLWKHPNLTGKLNSNSISQNSVH